MRYRHLRFPEGKGKALTFSYDDGVKSDVRLAEIFAKNGLKCTFNLTKVADRGAPGLNVDDVELWLAEGHEIAVHGYQHRAEGCLRPVEGIQDVLDCRRELERKFGRIIRGMAYPDTGITYFGPGASYESIKQYLKDLDIVYARTLGGDNNRFQLPTDWHQWMPTAHHDNPHIMEYIDEFLKIDLTVPMNGGRRFPRLFYIWGHSFEFDRKNNWHLIEEICEKFAQADDIWFATNMEIYEYVQAYRSLVYSADGKIIYNPTLYTIWFDIDNQPYCINSGETLYLPL